VSQQPGLGLQIDWEQIGRVAQLQLSVGRQAGAA
jgi:hypothetical protein